MRGLIQRVNQANVIVDATVVVAIEQGILLLLAIEASDSQQQADKLLQKILNYRIFSDAQDKMNLSLRDIQGGLLIVPQFTLAAETKKGLRPSFSSAATAEKSQQIFDYFCQHAKAHYDKVRCGIFGAYMQLNLCNDGPVTFLLTV